MFTVVLLIALSVVFLTSAVLLMEFRLRSPIVVALARIATPVRLPVSREAYSQRGITNVSGLRRQSNCFYVRCD
jgi:hypothetical protein